MNQNAPEQKRILEVNINHSLLKTLESTLNTSGEKSKQNNNDSSKKYAKILYNMAVIAEGEQVTNTSEFLSDISDLIAKK